MPGEPEGAIFGAITKDKTTINMPSPSVSADPINETIALSVTPTDRFMSGSLEVSLEVMVSQQNGFVDSLGTMVTYLNRTNGPETGQP